MPQSEILDRLAEAVAKLYRDIVPRLAQDALDAGLSPYEIIAEGLSKGMRIVGEQFKRNEVYIPEVLVACDAYYAGLNVVRPHIDRAERDKFLGTMVIGTIYGDVHTVGKDVAVPIFEAAGLNVIDLGVGVPAEGFVNAVKEHDAQIVGLGTYMTSSFMHTKHVVDALREAGVRDKVKVICGGPSVNPEAARRMGADDASDDAWEAVDKIKALLNQLVEEGKWKGAAA
ncbi:MAG: cobalamin B12-binding domain-containing protein [Armatimonadota bacterium]